MTTIEEKIAQQEANAGKVAVDAVNKAKENIAARKLENEAREVEKRLNSAQTTEDKALKELRLARKKEAAQKVYLETVSKAREEFEASGNWKVYDEAVEKAEDARDDAIAKAKRDIYGDDYWRF